MTLQLAAFRKHGRFAAEFQVMEAIDERERGMRKRSFAPTAYSQCEPW